MQRQGRKSTGRRSWLFDTTCSPNESDDIVSNAVVRKTFQAFCVLIVVPALSGGRILTELSTAQLIREPKVG
jgi:hypothetical protein